MLARPTKICSKCKVEKSLEEFSADRNRKDGKYPQCKLCHFISNRENGKKPEVKARRALEMRRRRADPEFRERENARLRELRNSTSDFKESQSKYWKEFYLDPVNQLARKERCRNRREDVHNRAQTLLSAAKQRDKNCSVTLDHILEGIRRGHCPVTGIMFDLGSDHQRITGRSRNPYSPSLDRINPNLGYTNENTRIVITHYNFMKGQLTDEEMAFICKRVIEFAPK